MNSLIWLALAGIVIWSGYFKFKEKMNFWPSKADFIVFVFGSGIIAAVQIWVGFVSTPWAFTSLACLFSMCMIALASSCIAWLMSKGYEEMQKYSQRCPQCDSKEVVNEEFTDIFDYGCDNGAQARLAVKSVKHNCCECGFTFTGYTNERDREQAVKNYLNR